MKRLFGVLINAAISSLLFVGVYCFIGVSKTTDEKVILLLTVLTVNMFCGMEQSDQIIKLTDELDRVKKDIYKK